MFEEFFSVECEAGLEEKEEDDSKRDRNILLLSGPAGALAFIHRVLQHKLTASCSFLGSGKSTAYLEAIKFVLGPYTEQRKRAGHHVVLLPVSLPTLQDPLGGIFKEGVYCYSDIISVASVVVIRVCAPKGCSMAFGGCLRSTQIDELKEEIQKGNVELVLLLDAYDELSRAAFSKNLWQSNNLESLRDQGKQPLGQPKVLITVREEALSELKGNYLNSFAPIETREKKKDTR